MPNMDKLRRSVELRRRKKALNARLKEVQKELDELDESTMESFIDEGVNNIKVDGVTLGIRRQMWAGLEGDRAEAVKAIYDSPSELGLRGTLTSNAQSLSSAVRARIAAAIEEDPKIEELDGPELIKAVFPMDIAPHLRVWTNFSVTARGVGADEDLKLACATEGCHRPHHAMGLCQRCYGKQRRGTL